MLRFDFKYYTQLRNVIRKVKYNKANYDILNSEIRAIDWSNIITEKQDISDAWKVFKKKLTHIEVRHIPPRTNKTTFKKNHGFP